MKKRCELLSIFGLTLVFDNAFCQNPQQQRIPGCQQNKKTGFPPVFLFLCPHFVLLYQTPKTILVAAQGPAPLQLLSR